MVIDGIDRGTILLKAINGASNPTVNIYKQWNIIATKVPMPKIEAKEIPAHDFGGENGEDAYIPSFIPIKPYDFTIEFAYKGKLDSCYDNIYLGLLKYLRGKAPATNDYDSITEGGFIMYDKHNKIGRKNVYLKNFEPDELIQMSDGDHLTFKLTFRVTDPATDVTLTDPNAKVTL